MASFASIRANDYTFAVEVKARIDDLDDDGSGVGSAAGLEIHIAGALPGETVRARIEHRSPHAPRAWAMLLAREGPESEERVAPACPGHGACGGCALQHLAYPAQLTFKRRLVERALGVPVEDVVASPHELHYRNKAKYVIAPGPRLGSYAPGSHRVVDMAGCQVPEEPIDAVARAAIRALDGVPAYDERARTGELRYLVVRANRDGELLVVLVAASTGARPALARAARALRTERPDVRGVVLNVNGSTSGSLFGAADDVLDGAGALADRVGDVELELSARAFFQINRPQAARLYAEVARAAGARPGLRAVDLYSGVGGIALTLAQRGARVVGVEAYGDAVQDARRSAAANGLGVDFIHADALFGLPEALRRLGAIDVLVVNPPRKGLSAGGRAAVLQARPPRLIYVSCNPRTLGADLRTLGYRVTWVRPFDLMPGTPHVETVAVADCPTGQSATA
jgi:23S rRNA (uracil-5-)-methyltransferase RumA